MVHLRMSAPIVNTEGTHGFSQGGAEQDAPTHVYGSGLDYS